MAILIQLIIALTTICAGVLAVFVYSSRSLTYSSRLLAAHLLSIAAWAYATLIVLRFESHFAVSAAFASAVALAITKYFFVIDFPARTKRSVMKHLIPGLVAFIIAGLSFVPGLYTTDFSSEQGFYVHIVDGPLAGLYALTISFLLLYPIFNLWHKFSTEQYTGRLHEQIRFLLIGISISFFIGLTTNSLLPVLFDIHYFNGIGPSVALVLAGFIVYIIRKHHFLGLSIGLQLGFIYTILISVIGVLYLTVLFVFEAFSYTSTTLHPILSGLITSIVGIFSLPHLDRYLRKKTDQFFFKDTYDAETVLNELSVVLNRSLELSKIKGHTKQTLKRELKASKVNIAVYPEQPLIKQTDIFHQNSVLSFPLLSNSRLIGRLILHKKRSGEPYTAADIRFLSTLSHHLALACERALLHKQLQDHSRELEYKVHQRTVELQDAYRSQQVMISNIAHGLQTPLTIIKSEIENLKTDVSLSKQIRSLEHSVTSVSLFIYDLLRLVQIESKGNRLELKELELGQFLTDIMSYVEVLAADQKVHLHSDLESTVYIHGDAKRLEEVLLVLISNALKYMSSEDKREISVRLQARGAVALISIADTGIGIPADALEKVFDRFYRVKDPAAGNAAGSGLGLSIAKALIHKHGGNIEVMSSVGVGTVFTITLPRLFVVD